MRKRIENSMSEDLKWKLSEVNLSKCEVDKMYKQIQELDKVIKAAYKSKKEFSEINSK